MTSGLVGTGTTNKNASKKGEPSFLLPVKRSWISSTISCQWRASIRRVSGRYLQLWEELGELYAEINFGIKRYRPMAQGSDGKLGNDFVEVSSPEKRGEEVSVKRSGNFSKLLVVKIDATFEFEARMIDRSALKKGDGQHASVSWSSIPKSK